MPSSSESEDKQHKTILTPTEKNKYFSNKDSDHEVVKSDINLKSQRCIELVESDDIEIPNSTKDHIAKKLSKIIEREFEFVESIDDTKKHVKSKKAKERVKLLKGFDVPIKLKNDVTIGKLNRPIVKRRIVEKDLLDETEKCKLVAIDGDWILNKKETKTWENRVRGEMFEYKRGSTEGSAYHYIEPTNEFTKLRKKNCWSEKKISRET